MVLVLWSSVNFNSSLFRRLRSWIWLSFLSTNNKHCAFLFAKSRLAPLKSTSIPRLELSAAKISIHLDKMLKREIEIPLSEPSIFWSDNMSVLRYVRNENKRFHTFVANRIAMIRDSSSPGQWYHLEGITNPGDHTTRGLSAEGLLSCDKWLMGPGFLWKSECQWPTQSLDISLHLPSNTTIPK